MLFEKNEPHDISSISKKQAGVPLPKKNRKMVYREFSPYANFITANFVTAVFQNYY